MSCKGRLIPTLSFIGDAMKIYMALVVGCAALSGCATTPTPPSNAAHVPADRLLAFQNKTPKATAVLIATRDQGFIGGGCFVSLTIDGVLAARIDPGETAKFYLQPGEKLLTVGRDALGAPLCSLGKDNFANRETILKPGEEKSFRLMTNTDGQFDIQRADAP